MQVTIRTLNDYFAPDAEASEQMCIDMKNSYLHYGFSPIIGDDLQRAVKGYLFGEPGDECFFYYKQIVKLLGYES